jgi:hypothetical protein
MWHLLSVKEKGVAPEMLLHIGAEYKEESKIRSQMPGSEERWISFIKALPKILFLKTKSCVDTTKKSLILKDNIFLSDVFLFICVRTTMKLGLIICHSKFHK